jgi:hypothetical protein
MASRNRIDKTYGWAQWAMAQQLHNIGGNEPINASLIWFCKHLKNPLWQQSENVVFGQSRNVVLTAPNFGDAGRTTTHDASR